MKLIGPSCVATVYDSQCDLHQRPRGKRSRGRSWGRVRAIAGTAGAGTRGSSPEGCGLRGAAGSVPVPALDVRCIAGPPCLESQWAHPNRGQQGASSTPAPRHAVHSEYRLPSALCPAQGLAAFPAPAPPGSQAASFHRSPVRIRHGPGKLLLILRLTVSQNKRL